MIVDFLEKLLSFCLAGLIKGLSNNLFDILRARVQTYADNTNCAPIE